MGVRTVGWKRLRTIVIASALACAAGVLSAPSSAGTAWNEGGYAVFYIAERGEANDVRIWSQNGAYIVEDVGARVVPGTGCERVTRHLAACDGSGNPSLHVESRDLNDTIRNELAAQSGILGGRGSDVLRGGSDRDSLFGGPGEDLLNGRAGIDALDGGLGPDDLRGGGGLDVVSYGRRTEPLRVTLDGNRNDGEKGEEDVVRPDVEDVSGGAGNDVIIGDGERNGLHGGPGDDMIDGGLGGDISFGDEGFDTVTYGSRTNPVLGEWTSYCDSGEPGEADCIDQAIERIIGGSNDDVLVAYSKESGAATLDGGPGNDFLGASDELESSTTRLLGRAGDDTLKADNGRADTVKCGAGHDSATYDDLDVVDLSCEDATLAKLALSFRSR